MVKIYPKEVIDDNNISPQSFLETTNKTTLDRDIVLTLDDTRKYENHLKSLLIKFADNYPNETNELLNNFNVTDELSKGVKIDILKGNFNSVPKPISPVKS